MDESNSISQRRQDRSRVLLPAKLEIAGREIPVMMRNLSAEGVLIEGDVLPVEGSNVLFKRKELIVEGRVAWSRGRRAGLRFQQPLNPENLMRHAPPPPKLAPISEPHAARPSNLALDAERLALQSIWPQADDKSE